MLTAEGCADRRFRLWDAVPEKYEWLLIADPRHVNYLSAFFVNPISFSTCERGLLFLERGGRTILLAENFSRRSAVCEPFVDEEITTRWYDHRTSIRNRDHVLFNLASQLKPLIAGRQGLIESEWAPVMLADEMELGVEARALELGSILRQLRRQKESDEIALLERCMRACEAGHERALEVVAPGVTDLDVYREVQSAAVASAGCPAVVYGDFRSVNADVPKRGGLPVGESLKAGELLILDYSVMINGYRSDFTNTIAVGTPTSRQQQIFELCEMAVTAGEELLTAGSSASDVYEAVSTVFEETGHSALVHHAGHGIGLAHPESPILVPESHDTLLAGDVITLEPGLYVEGVGGVRLEHNYLIKSSGCRRLSNHRFALTR